MDINGIDVGTKLVFVLTAALVATAPREWPEAANAVRRECIELLDQAQEAMQTALKTTNVREMYQMLSLVSLLMGKAQKKLETKKRERKL